MGIATGFTAARMAVIEAMSVVNGAISGDNLILERRDGSTFVAGNVRGPQGPKGDGNRRWIYNAAYVTNDTVGYAGRVWRALGASTNKPPALFTSLWQPVSGGDNDSWALDDPYFDGDLLSTNFQTFWGSGAPVTTLTTLAGEFESGRQALKIVLPAGSGQRVYQNDENIVRGGEIITVKIRAKRSAGASGGTLDILLSQNIAGRPEPFEGDTPTSAASINVTGSWATYTVRLTAVNGKPRAKVQWIVSNYAASACTVVIDYVEVTRSKNNREVEAPTVDPNAPQFGSECIRDGNVVTLHIHVKPTINWPSYGWSLMTIPPRFRSHRMVELNFSNAGNTIYPVMFNADGSVTSRTPIPANTDLVGTFTYLVPG